MSEPTMTITWRYLPELPPEPLSELDAENYIIAYDNGESDNVTFCAWYTDVNCWEDVGSYQIDNIYAWAEWPAAPPVRETR